MTEVQFMRKLEREISALRDWAIKWYKWKTTEPVFGHES